MITPIPNLHFSRNFDNNKSAELRDFRNVTRNQEGCVAL